MYSPHIRKQDSRGPTSAALDDVGEFVPRSIVLVLFQTSWLSHIHTLSVPGIPHALNFEGGWVPVVCWMLSEGSLLGIWCVCPSEGGFPSSPKPSATDIGMQ